MRVTDTGAILTRSAVPRATSTWGSCSHPTTLAVVVVAASRQALEARAEITEALTQWGAVTWPEDPAEYWTHEGEDDDEPVVGQCHPTRCWDPSGPLLSHERILRGPQEMTLRVRQSLTGPST